MLRVLRVVSGTQILMEQSEAEHRLISVAIIVLAHLPRIGSTGLGSTGRNGCGLITGTTGSSEIVKINSVNQNMLSVW